MRQNLWFKAKRYGWGWYPATWQGWVILLAYLVAVAWFSIIIDTSSHSVSDTMYALAIPFGVLTTFLIIICYLTGEKPRWRWGKESKR